MAESACHVCGSETTVDGMPYRCAYCGNPVCTDHRLPENHTCTGSRLPDDESPEGRESMAMRLNEDQTVGTTPSDIGQSSPDVALDGSVVGAEEKSEVTESDPWWRRLLPW
ncbi:zinc finger AN1 domain-containing stress-associated protein [Halobellus marinus]|uniref:zinc finger AN1 domain-containing stress-associated protein n=2 Tax=Halobellus TaxID=1073986 RepID=UPI0028B1D648|nr:zinc finger AN1 domain-containing stress-associated protein [Halobellus sp. DFY28]